jgi:hypothetical protein
MAVAFATMKRWYGMGRVRYLGLARNACHLSLVTRQVYKQRRSIALAEWRALAR